jgi:hypothetical protein
LAVAALQSQRPAPYRATWIQALERRISNPDAALVELGQTMTPPISKHAYAALLRRALRGGGVTTGAAAPRQRRRCDDQTTEPSSGMGRPAKVS